MVAGVKQPSSVIFNHMLRVCSEERNANVFMSVVHDMRMHPSVDVISLHPAMFDTMLIQIANSGDATAVEELLDYMQHSTCPPPQKLVTHARYFTIFLFILLSHYPFFFHHLF